jgi:16S rRNA (uracil1498-N3)-methyltransferase
VTADLFFMEKARLAGAECVLEGPEHHHLARVARIRPGREVWLFDEEGGKVQARVESVGPERTRLILGRRVPPGSSGPRVTLAQGLLKGRAWDDVISGAVEWGVAVLRPILASRSVVRLEGSAERKIERWRQVALAAAKQCRSGRVPGFAAPVSLTAFLAEAEPARKVILAEQGGRPFRDVLADAPAPGSSEREAWTLLVGPEGGFAEAELAEAAAAGFEPVSLGPNILRAETAAVSAVAILTHARSL